MKFHGFLGHKLRVGRCQWQLQWDILGLVYGVLVKVPHASLGAASGRIHPSETL